MRSLAIVVAVLALLGAPFVAIAGDGTYRRVDPRKPSFDGD